MNKFECGKNITFFYKWNMNIPPKIKEYSCFIDKYKFKNK